MASSGVMPNAVPVSNYTTPVNTSSFTAVTTQPLHKTSSSGTSSVTAAAGALFRGSRGFFSLFSSRHCAASADPTRWRKPNLPPTLPPESSDCTSYGFPNGESFPVLYKQTNSILSEQATFAPSKQAEDSFSSTSASEPSSYASDGSHDFSLLSEVMDPNVMYPQYPQHEEIMNSSSDRPPATGGFKDYISGLTVAIRNFGRPATTWVRPDYVINQELQYNYANLESKMSRQCPQNTFTTSHSPFSATLHQGKRFNVQDSGFDQTLGAPFENSDCCGDPQSSNFPRTPGSDIPDWTPASDPPPYTMWSNAELSVMQTEDLLAAGREEEKFLAEQNSRYQYYNKLHLQKMQQHQQNQTTDDSGMVDEGWYIVMNEACVPPDEQGLCTEESYLAYENRASKYDETAMVGSPKLLMTESSDNFLLQSCLPPQSIAVDNLNYRIWSFNNESTNSKCEEARQIESVPPHITKSQLNPYAKEWTGTCCSKMKLNPEAKEWVPKDERDQHVKKQSKTISETDVENGLVLITISSAAIKTESNADDGFMNESCSSKICQENYRKQIRPTTADCNRFNEKNSREIEFTKSSIEQNQTCSVASPLTISSSLVCESASKEVSSPGVIPCPVPDISVKVNESACDTYLLGLDCVDSICSNIDSDNSDNRLGKANCEAAAAASIISKVDLKQDSKERKLLDEEKWRRFHSSDCESDQDDESEVESVLCVSHRECDKPRCAESSEEEDTSEEESSEEESDQDDESEVESVICASHSDRVKPRCARSSKDEDSSEDESSEEESEPEDLVIDLLNTPCGWWRSGCDSEDDSTEDEDVEGVTDDHDLATDDHDLDTDDDIVFDCSVDEGDCTSVKDKKSKLFLSPLQKVNLRWNSQINENVIGRTSCKISFDEVVRVESVDKNIERSGVEWERYAMEAKRFRENVLQPHGAIISRVLGAEHRSMIFKERFAEAGSSDADGGIAIGDAGQTLLEDGEESDGDTLVSIWVGTHDVSRKALPARSCSCETDKNPDSVTGRILYLKFSE